MFAGLSLVHSPGLRLAVDDVTSLNGLGLAFHALLETK